MTTETRCRPQQAKLFTLLLLFSGVFMVLLGMSASAYYVSAACLLLQAVLLWRGSAFKLFNAIMLLNQFTGILLILVLWLGDALHLPKLDISGVMLIGNVFSGGPLMSVLTLPILACLYFSPLLPAWFGARHG